MITLVASFWLMALSFSATENNFWIFLAGVLLSVICLAVPKWMRD